MKTAMVCITAFLFFSCSSNDHKDRELLGSLTQAMENSNDLIVEKTNRMNEELLNRLADPVYRQRTLIWQPKALLAKTCTDSLVNYIERLKSSLKEGPGMEKHPGKVLNMDDTKTPAIIFYKNNGKEEFKKRLKDFKEHLLAIDEEVKNRYEREINSFTGFSDSAINDAGLLGYAI